MNAIATHAAGALCWAELRTRDANQCRDFYSALFDWSTDDLPIGEEIYYTMLRVGDNNVAALCRMDDWLQKQEISSMWLNFFAVSSADDTTERARALNAEVESSPFDVFDAGRMAVLRDPAGVMFALWQAGENVGAQLVDKPGALMGCDLHTENVGQSVGFYEQLFGWKMQAPREASAAAPVRLTNQERPFALIQAIAGVESPISAQCIPCFGLEDCNKGAEKAKSLGGKIMTPPHDLADLGTYAIIQDPQGANFSILQPV